MTETFTWQVGKAETFEWTLPVVVHEVEQTHLFVDDDGETQFVDSETGQTFKETE